MADPGMSAPPTDDDEEPIKIILLGDSATGKSKLVERYLVDNYAQHQLSTYALTLFRKDVVVDGKSYHIDFWDTAGQERFQSLHPSYYHRAHACILCFDVTRKVTYKNLVTWYKELREFRKNIPCICVANKVDVDAAVTSKAFAFPEKHHMRLFMCSAADGTNVVQAFDAAVQAAIECSKRPPDDFYEDVMALLAEGSDPART
ncbi:hypothetical protein KFE25_011450 [Diacronema lutheri]|uniref:Rab-like protein 2A n=1 Tax=Diacronema lutheri TaxID=2081491 RepID=A0A8J5XKW0_DIALT|nr:hypothetical protein KFE25_011450 [Diacronema lutheri]